VKQGDSELELPRISESGEGELLRLVAGLRANRPDAAELGSLASQLAVRGISVTVPASAPPAASSAWKKWALAGGGAASVLALWVAAREPQASLAISPRATPNIPASQAAVESGSGRRTGSARAGQLEPAAPVASASALAPALLEEHAAEKSAALARPLPATTDEGTSRPEMASARNEPASRRTPSAAASPSVATNAPPDLAIPTEIELLRDARLALKQSPARALELAESHARAYPGGKLSQERELMAITALVSLGRRTAALARASRFEQTFPQSPYRKQIGELLR
jgi:hypothetical protein